MSARTTCLQFGSVAALALLGSVGGALAQVTLDGTANPDFKGPLDGPDYQIRAELGRRAGGNLFHSFERFGLRTLDDGTIESATFSGPGAIRNVISRVTGGDPSEINGIIRSTIDGADFLFLNPAGVMFGPNASLDVKGAFHVSTADELRFADGERFSARLGGANSFTVAPAVAFGFLGSSPEPIIVDRSKLEVPAGDALSLVGGNITIDGGNSGTQGIIRAGDGAVSLLASGGHGDARIADGRLAGDSRADIKLRNQTMVDTSGDGGGRVVIRGNRFVLEGQSFVLADNLGAAEGRGELDVAANTVGVLAGSALTADALGAGAAGVVAVRAGEVEIRDGGFIRSSAFAEGSAGQVIVNADRLLIDGAGAEGFAGILSDAAQGTGNAGVVTIEADNLELAAGGLISSSTFAEGTAGTVNVAADRLLIDGGDAGGLTGIASRAEAGSIGIAGSVEVDAGSLDIVDQGQIASSTFGAGSAGEVIVRADRLRVDGEGNFAGIFSNAEASTGDAGIVAVQAGHLELVAGGSLSSNTFAEGTAGTVNIRADRLLIDGSDADHLTGIASRAEEGAIGIAGSVMVDAGTLNIVHEGQIDTSSFAAAKAGEVVVHADRLRIDGRGGFAGVLSDVSSPGTAGVVTIGAGEMELVAGGLISSSAFGDGDAGTVIITADQLLIDGAGAAGLTGIATQPVFSTGSGGSVMVHAGTLTILERGEISSSTSGAGAAGEVIVEADRLLRIDGGGSFAGIFSGTGGTGDAGAVTVLAAEVELAAGGLISSDTSGEGDAGTVNVTTDALISDGAGLAVLTGISSGSVGPGLAGAIMILAASRIVLDKGSEISSVTGSSGGGDIRIEARDLILLRDGSRIGVDVQSGGARAGNIEIDPTFLVLDESEIGATADAGSGGEIDITADNLILSPGSAITARAGPAGIAGTVMVSAPETDLSGGIVVLDAALLDAASQLRERCAARRDIEASSFTGVGRGGLPPSPDGPLLSPYVLRKKPAAGSAVEADRPKAAPGAVTLTLPCRGPG